MSQDPSGIRLYYKYVVEKDDEDEEQRGDREEVSYLTDDGGEPFVPSLIRIPSDDEEHDPSGIHLQYKHKEDGGERDGGMRFLEPTLIRLPPAEEHKRENITSSDADDDNKKPAATADRSRVSDHDASPRTVVKTLGGPVHRVQFPQADSPTGVHQSKYKMEMKASKNSHKTAPPSAFDAASLGDPWPSSGITTLPGAQWASPESARIKYDTMDQAATGNQPMLRPHFVSSQAMEPPLPGCAQLKSPPVLSASMKVAAAAAAAPPTTTGPNNNNEDLMHVKASIRARDKMNVKMKWVPTDNRAPFGPAFKDQARGFNPIEEERIATDNRVLFGPKFKDQARGFNPIEEERIATDNRVPFGPKFKDQARGFNPIDSKEERTEDAVLHGSSAGGPTFKHQTREEDAEGEIDTEAGDATSADRGGAISNGTTRLVEAELVIPAEAEVMEEKPLRKACLVVLALLLIGAIVGAIVGSSDSKSVTQPVATDCDQAIALELGNLEAFKPADASTDTWGSCNISNPFGALAAEVGWYQFIGNDTNYTATTCGAELSDWAWSSIDTYYIKVYAGIECQNLTCSSLVGSHSSQRFCNDGVSWLAESGIQYWIQVLVSSVEDPFIAVFPTPLNQDCEAAIMLEAGQETVKGTTLGALAGPKDSFCGTTTDDPFELPEAGPAVWYSVTGTDENLTAFTCADFDNQILVYNGTCGSLTCIDGNDYYDASTICSGEYVYAAAVGWFAKAGMVYYIKVTTNVVRAYITAGNFELRIQIGEKEILYPPEPTLPPGPPPENDNCENATWVSSHELIVESTSWATPSDSLSDEQSVCNGESPLSYHLSPDVWYQFNGTGEWHTATTCTGVYELNVFDSYIVIYSGTCSNLTCITSNDDFFSSDCTPYNAIVSWPTQEGEIYLIRVSGKNEYTTGGFGIQIDDGKIEPPPEPVNNYCETATLLELDQVVNGTTFAATRSGELPACDQSTYFPGEGSPDVWYHLPGTGDVLTVTTCTHTSLDNSGFDAVLAVYTGNCTSEMICIAENDDDHRDSCSDYGAAGVSWQSELNEEYHIRVYGYDSFGYEYPIGTFGIKAYKGTPDGKPLPDPDSTIPPQL